MLSGGIAVLLSRIVGIIPAKKEGQYGTIALQTAGPPFETRLKENIPTVDLSRSTVIKT